MRRILKRFLSVLLVVVLTASGFSLDCFAAEADQKPVLTEGMSLTGNDGLGNLLTGKLGQEAEKQLENNGYNVFDVEIEATIAEVSYEVKEDCTLLVAVYDETEMEMLALGSEEVFSDETETQVRLETEKMPEYFIIKAYLVNTETMKPLCTVYESAMYTKEMQDFLQKTTEDFEEEKVVNLDSDITTNYLVCAEDTKIIDGKSGENQVTSVDEDSSTYVIENANTSITSLKKGDVFVYPYQEGQILVVKVGTIEITGTTAVISGAETSLEEAFDYVRIEGNAETEDVEVDDSECEEGVIYNGMELETNGGESIVSAEDTSKGSGKEEYKATFQFLDKKLAEKESENLEGAVTLSGEAGISLSVEVEVYITLKEQFVKLQFDYGVSLEIALTGEVSATVPLAVFFVTPVPGVSIELKPSVVFDFSAKLEFSGKYGGTVGVKAGSSGIQNLTTTPRIETGIEAEGTFFVGLSLKPKMKIIHDKIAKAELEAEAGVEFTAAPDETTVNGNLNDLKKTNLNIHVCKQCLNGTIAAKVEIGCSVSFLGLEKLTFEMKKTFNRKIGSFYFSLDTWNGGFGACPNKMFRVTILVVDEKGNPVADAYVNDKEKTDSRGMATIWLKGGVHSVEVEKENFKTQKRNITVDSAWKVLIRLVEGDGTESAIASFKTVKSNTHTAAITKDGSLYMWGYNNNGQVGDGTTINRSIPVKVLDNVKSVECCTGTTLAILENGELYVWGKDTGSYVPKKMLDNVKIAKTGSNNGTFLAITKAGELYMWGHNEYGQLGSGTSGFFTTPYKVLENVKDAECSLYTSVAITEDGNLYVWGRNQYGQVGVGNTDNCYTPTVVCSNVKSAECSTATTIAITEDDNLYMWGYNGYGQVGDGTTISRNKPCRIMENVKSAECSDIGTTMAVTKDGDLYMWGYRQLNSPVKFFENVKSAEISEIRSYVVTAITKDGDLYMWGDNTFGQIGNGSVINVGEPYKVLENVKSAKCSTNGTTLALTNENDLYMWGYNSNGQVGNGTNEQNVTEPEKILANVKNAVCQDWVSTAVTNSGKLYMWGDNYWKQIGYGQENKVTVPYRIILKEDKFLTTNGVNNCILTKENDGEILSKTFTGLNPEEIYNVYLMKNSEANKKFDPENLYYVNQISADKNGTLSINCKRPVGESEVEFVVAAAATDISKVLLKAENTVYDGKEHFVNVKASYNGKELIEGTDYEISGQYKGTDAGAYTITITGTGDYTGMTEIVWKVLEEGQKDEETDWVPGDVNGDKNIDAQDALFILKSVAKMINLTRQQEKAADVTKDETADAQDALMILKYVAKMIPDFG